MVDGHVVPRHGETGTEELGERTGIGQHQVRSAVFKRVIDFREARGVLCSNVEIASVLEVLVDRPRPFDSVLVLFLQGSKQHFQRFLAPEDRCDCFWMADSCGEADPLEVSFSNPSKSLKTGRQLDAPAIMGELMNLIDDDKSDRLEVSLHHPRRKDGLKSLGCSNQKIRRHCSLFSPLCLTTVSLPDRGATRRASD